MNDPVNLVDRGGRCSSNVPFYDAYGWMGGMFDWNYQMVLNSMMNSMMSGGINGEQAVSTLGGYANACIPVYEAQYPIPSGGGGGSGTTGSAANVIGNTGSTTGGGSLNTPPYFSLFAEQAKFDLSAHIQNISISCTNFLSQLGITQQAFLQKLNQIQIINAEQSVLPMSALGIDSAAAAALGVSGWTVGQVWEYGGFPNDPLQRYVINFSPTSNNYIFMRSNGISAGAIGHEILHKFIGPNGKTIDDTYIMTTFNIPGQSSIAIDGVFKNACL